jgi:tRNA A-37 threonylcarbamoyl transferase component Bud32
VDGAALVELPDEPESLVVQRDSLSRLQPVASVAGRYTIISKIGQGGWGGVYRAYQHSTKREVALKVLRQDVAHDEQVRRRFHREAEAVSRLKHPNTVTIYDFGETPDGLLFLAMEYIEGQSLDAVIREEGPLAPQRAVRIARQIALSLAEAHEKGIVHRDVKPHNIMLTRVDDGEDFVKVLDFGVAKLVSIDSTLTSTGSTFGTPEYMSPEQVQSKDIDHRSDLYALGVILFEMLSGAPPFSGKSAVTVAIHHIRKRPPALRAPGGLPRPLASLVRRLLSKKTSDRPESARVVAAELERISRQLDGLDSRRTTQVVQQVVGGVASNWTAALTILAVVCMVIVALVVFRDRFLPKEAGGGRLEAGVETTEEPDAGAARVLPLEDQPKAEEGPHHPHANVSASEPADVASEQAGGGRPEAGAETTEEPHAGDARVLPREDQPKVEEGPHHPHANVSASEPADVASEQAGGGRPEAGAETTEEPHAGDARVLPREDQPKVEEGPHHPPAEHASAEHAPAEHAPAEHAPAEHASAEHASVEHASVEHASLRVRFEADVDDVAVRAGGKVVCRTPCTLEAKPGESRRYRFVKEGYQPARRTVRFKAGMGPVRVEMIPLSLSEVDGLKDEKGAAAEDGLK